MAFCQNRTTKGIWGPGENPALAFFIVCLLVECFVFTQSAFPLTVRPYTQAQTPSDAHIAGGRDPQFDGERAIERFQKHSREEKLIQKRSEEKRRDSGQAQEVQENIVQEQRASQQDAQQKKQEADSIYGRTTGLDSYSIDKDGGIWRSHVALLVEAWNVLSRDLYSNASRSHLTDFSYNDLFNATGMHRQTVDPAGRITETSISGITYQEGEFLRNLRSENKETTRTEITTTFHPTGNQVTRTELFGFEYQGGRDGKVISQKAKITDLTGPGNPVLQEIFNMEYDGDNVISSQSRVTDLVTSTVTESNTKNSFSGHRLISGVTESATKDFVSHTLTQQSFTQNVSYNDGGVTKVDAKGMTTTQAIDTAGNPVDDFIQTTETTQFMEGFFGIPNPTEIVSVTKMINNVDVQTTESRQIQKLLRDSYGNLLNASGTEVATTVNADRSVIQNTKSNLDFIVRADQAYLVGRNDHISTKDLINDQDILTDSLFRIRLGALGEVLDGMRTARTHATNSDGSVVSDSESTEYFDRAAKVNELGLIRRESSNRTVDAIVKENASVSNEKRIYTQRHDDFNRVVSAGETVEGITTDAIGGETRVTGSVEYAVGLRSNQVYAVEAKNRITSKDPFNFLYTESNQTTRFEADVNTGRALRGRGITESTSYRMKDDGTVLPDLLVINSRSEDVLSGLSQSNGFGLSERNTFSEANDLLGGFITRRNERLVQSLNSVGKIESAYAVSESLGQDGGNNRQVRNLTRTDFKINANQLTPTSTKSIEVSTDKRDGSYRVVAREDIHRTDALGRYFAIDDKHPETSGYQIVLHYDVTQRPIPANMPSLDRLYQQFFGQGSPR